MKKNLGLRELGALAGVSLVVHLAAASALAGGSPIHSEWNGPVESTLRFVRLPGDANRGSFVHCPAGQACYILGSAEGYTASEVAQVTARAEGRAEAINGVNSKVTLATVAGGGAVLAAKGAKRVGGGAMAAGRSLVTPLKSGWSRLTGLLRSARVINTPPPTPALPALVGATNATSAAATASRIGMLSRFGGFLRAAGWVGAIASVGMMVWEHYASKDAEALAKTDEAFNGQDSVVLASGDDAENLVEEINPALANVRASESIAVAEHPAVSTGTLAAKVAKVLPAATDTGSESVDPDAAFSVGRRAASAR